MLLASSFSRTLLNISRTVPNVAIFFSRLMLSEAAKGGNIGMWETVTEILKAKDLLKEVHQSIRDQTECGALLVYVTFEDKLIDFWTPDLVQ